MQNWLLLLFRGFLFPFKICHSIDSYIIRNKHLRQKFQRRKMGVAVEGKEVRDGEGGWVWVSEGGTEGFIGRVCQYRYTVVHLCNYSSGVYIGNTGGHLL